MPDRADSPQAEAARAPRTAMSERERAKQFGEVMRILMQRQQFYVQLTETYLVAPLADRTRLLDGAGLHPNTLRQYLRGESLPSDATVRLLADALGVPRGVLLYAAEYLTLDDLAHYPGPYTTLEAVQADMRDVEVLPLDAATKERITADLRTTERILRLLDAETVEADWHTMPDERREVLDLLIELWDAPIPTMPPMTIQDQREADAWAGAGGAAPDAKSPIPTPSPVTEAAPVVSRSNEAARQRH